MSTTSCRSLLSTLLTVTLATGSLLCGSRAASAQNAGWPGPSFQGAQSIPTGSKPESKLWWNDGGWWACLWSTASQSFTIHRLLVQTQTWVDSGTAVDSRPKSRADCLWSGAKLYIASHEYTDGVGAPGHPLELYRYSYDPNRDRYSLDVGFPTLIGDAKTETLVIDVDSTGTLWAVWMAGFRVWLAHTEGDDRSWSTPTVHPANTSNLDEDDIASIVSFQGGKIGVLWSDQVTDAFRFTFHEDGAPATAWSPVETVLAGPGIAEDDICLRAARDGRVFAALTTNTAEVRLAVRSPAGTWSDQRVAADQDDWCHPIVVLEEEARLVHVFGTTPVALGAIHEKTAAMDALAFAPGVGTPVIKEAGNPAIGEATSTKQSVSGATGLVVLASHHARHRYSHHHDTLGGPRPSAPVAVLHADVRESFVPVTVQFHDASSGRPTAWAWTFGDGTTSTQRYPVHAYSQPGRYTVSLRVTNALGTDTVTRTNLIQVEALPASLVLRPIADGHAYQGSPDSNRGGLGYLRIRGGRDSDYRAFLKFFVPPSQGQIAAAELRLACIDGASSRDAGSLYRVSNAWEEPTLTWNDMPALDTTPIGHFQDATTGGSIALDVGSAVSGSGTVSFGLRSSDFHSVSYSSRQGATPPELRLDYSQAFSALPQAGFEADRTSGSAPLMVQFFDATNGRADSWSWDFGDGYTSDLQNPSHAYEQPGRYVVSLTVTNSNGADTRSGRDPVCVSPRASPPARDF